ncbi:MAG: dihydrodipicolinate synthase family protein [Fimbriimonadaceae bacterium]|nr:dihydrodipicolinate synthase family protein [Fimbriimonadaceae bacterium]
MLQPGVYPAMVTPMNSDGTVDLVSAARLLARFEAHGCRGAVIAGTNGEGPSLAAVEKRDLLRDLAPTANEMNLILGIATSSLAEAVWSVGQAAKAGATAALVMPPSYFREASMTGLRDWYLRLLDASPVPVLVYNLPQRTGVTLDAEFLVGLTNHPRFAGAKDSSGNASNLEEYRQCVHPRHCLFTGDETLLMQALENGWQGTISGAANVLSERIVRVVSEWFVGSEDQARIQFQFIEPLIRLVRAQPQPATHKSILQAWGAIASKSVRLPLTAEDADPVRREIESKLGVESR